MSKKVGAKRKGANGYKLPDPIPNGETLTDLHKKKWRIGPSIGVGGFGEIYSASDVIEGPKKSISYPYVIKIEPHENGPLFVEMHFYMRVGKQEEIDEWTKQKQLKYLGMPRLIGSGSHECNSQKYRFIVMDRYAKDLWSLFIENNRVFPMLTVLRIGYQVINTLEYIHSKGYVHADIKGANLLLGMKKGTENQVNVVDFGMATKYSKDSKPDPKKAHNGTAEYTSRDAHTGVMSMRGDFEILGYNMLQWLCSVLPWEDSLTNVLKLQEQKVKYMCNIPSLMKKCFNKTTPPVFIVKYFEYIAKMSIDQVPDYDYCRSLIEDELEKIGCPLEGKLEFSTSKKTSVSVTKPRGKGKAKIENEDDDEPSPPKKPRAKAGKSNGSSVSVGRKRGKAEVISSSEDEESEDEDTPIRNGKSNSASAQRKTFRKKVQETMKPGWKDAATSIASNISRPGEYVSVNGNAVKTRKRPVQ